MTAVVVVAGRNESAFAEALRADLARAGHDVTVAEALPSQPGAHVVLLWSAALASTHAIDAQALIGLWSDDRLLIARRDETPLPLGLRDLPSLPPTAHEPDCVAAIRAELERSIGVVVGSATAAAPGAIAAASARTSTTSNQEIELEFWRAIKDGSDPDDFELYLQQFPQGIYAALAERKLAVLKGLAPAQPSTESAERQGKEDEEAAKREAEARRRLADVRARPEANFPPPGAAYAKRVGAVDARDFAEGKARAEVQAAGKEVEGAKREAELKKKLSEAPRAKLPVAPIIATIIAVAGVGGGAYYYFTAEKRAAEAETLVILQEAAKASKDLQAAQATQLEALKALEQARAAEEAARKSGDMARLKEAQEAARRAEVDAAKQTELVKQREAAVLDARKKAEDASKKSAQVAETKKAEVAVASAPRPAPVKSEEPKAEAPKAEAPKAEEPKAEAPKAAPTPAAPVAAEAPAKKAAPMSRSERERVADEEAARKALATASRTPASEPTAVASVSPAPTGEPSAPAVAKSAASENEVLYQQALAMEQDGNAAQAIRIYRRAARAGSGKAAKRLGEIYDGGIAGVPRDYAESLQWYETARQLGETVEAASGRRAGAPAAETPSQVASAPTPPRIVAEVPKSAPKSVEPAPVKSAPVRRETPKAEAVKPAPAPAPAAKGPGAVAPSPAASGTDPAEDLLVQAIAAENAARYQEAVRLYRRVALGSGIVAGIAAHRLGEIYQRGLPDVARDYAESLEMFSRAQTQGVTADDRAMSLQPAAREVLTRARQAASERFGPPDSAAIAEAAAKSAQQVAEAGRREAFFGVGILLSLVALAIGLVLFFTRRKRARALGAVPDSRPPPPPNGLQLPLRAGDVEGSLFVSYSHKDRSRVEPIVSAIEGMGRRVWMDRTDITGQAGWAGQIVRAIRECRAVVLMASPNSYSSDQVVRELYLAMNHRKTIVPIEIEPADLPDELQYILAPFQHHRLSGGETREVLGRALAAV